MYIVKKSRTPNCRCFLMRCMEVNVCRTDAGEQYENTWEKAYVLTTKLCLTLCDLVDYNPSGSSVHGIF